ncbi:histidine phosphatase superfamily [Chytriomyces sp. MP71]|nr:histidine phosphatase superfamily [Chytriomyces sp. MP71]
MDANRTTSPISFTIGDSGQEKPNRTISSASVGSLASSGGFPIEEPYSPPTTRLCVAMVGLPARGKTYTGRKVARYLNWLGHPSEIFNVGNYRRKEVGAKQPHNFFDPSNEESAFMRQKIADLALDDMVAWFHDLEAKEEIEKEMYRLDSVTARESASSQGTGQGPTQKRGSIPGKMTSTPSLATKFAVKKSQVGSARVAIYDATNSTKERRRLIMERCERENIQVMFVESICDRMDVVLANIKEVKLSSPDYMNTPPEQAVKDFMSRIYHYSKTYETLSRSENNSKISFVKLINIGERVLVNNVRGYIQSRIVYFLMNLNITPRCVYFSRHGESAFNVEGKIGGDSDLSPRGWMYANSLPEIIRKQMEDQQALAREAEEGAREMTGVWREWLQKDDGANVGGKEIKRISEEEGGAAIFPAIEAASDLGAREGSDKVPTNPKPTLTVWTSTLKRTIQTASHLAYPQLQWKALDELDSGVCDGLTYEDIEERYPEDFAARDDDKYNYRYKGGESYADLVRRLEPVTLELERHHEKNHPILIIGHQAVLRALYAYFMNLSHEELPYVKIPLHTVIKLTFKAYGCLEERFKVDIEAVDTHRPRIQAPLHVNAHTELAIPESSTENLEDVDEKKVSKKAKNGQR